MDIQVALNYCRTPRSLGAETGLWMIIVLFVLEIIAFSSSWAQDPKEQVSSILRIEVSKDKSVSVYDMKGNLVVSEPKVSANAMPESTDTRGRFLASDEVQERGPSFPIQGFSQGPQMKLFQETARGTITETGISSYSPLAAPNLAMYTGTGSNNTYSYTGSTHMLSVNISVVNNGNADAGAFRDGWYLSTNTLITVSDYLVTSAVHTSLSYGFYANKSSVIGLDNIILLPSGTYYVGVIIDDLSQVTESDETDNAVYYTPTIGYTGAPNLTLYTGTGAINTYNYTSSTHVLAVNSSVWNAGGVDAGAFRVGWYLSTNTTISTTDYLVATASQTSLFYGYYANKSGSINLDNVSGLPAGTYYVGALFDDLSQVSELDETDNTVYFTPSMAYTGAGVAAISLSTSSLSFGSITVGSSSQKTLTVSNTGNAVLNISSISSNLSVFTVSPTSFSVSSGGNQTVTVTFIPSAAGSYSGTITINHDAPGSPTTVSVTGTGGVVPAPAISVSASSLAFGNVNTGSNAQKTFTVSNTGTATLSVSNITSNVAGFTASPTSFNILAGGAAQTVTVTFTPTAVTSYSGTLSVTHNATGSPTQISLTGTGAGAAAISLSTSSLSFGTVNLGSSSSQTLNVTNSGNLPVTVTNLTSSNSSYVANPTSFTLSPGGTQVVTVTFTPASGGTQSATFTFTSNASTSPTFSASGLGQTRVTTSSTVIGRFSGGIPPSTWVLMSIPYKLDNTAASTLSSQLTGSTPWKLYIYQSGQNVEYTNASDALSVARAFWFKTTAKTASFNLSFGAGDLVGGSTYTLTVPSGWSLVGPPFVSEEASWTPVNTTTGSSGVRVYKYMHESSSWLLLNPASERMRPFGGYAVYNGTGASASFTFVRGGPLSSIKEWQPGDGWYGVLAIGETRLRIGEHKMASAGEDGFDYPMPPPRPDSDAQDPYVSEGLWSDIKPVAENAVTRWKITVDPRTNQSLKLEELVALPEGWGIMIDGIPNQGALKLKEGEEIHFSKAIRSPIVMTVLVGPAEMVEKESLPTQFVLYQNYPNPFNPSTTIRYGLVTESNVSARVYDLLGNQISTIVQENHKPGYYTVRWEGCDEKGVAVSSGIYFLRLTVGGRSEVMKMVLVR